MKMSGITFVVYNPPQLGLPYLAVMIAPNGEVVAVPFETPAEAENHNIESAAKTTHYAPASRRE